MSPENWFCQLKKTELRAEGEQEMNVEVIQPR